MTPAEVEVSVILPCLNEEDSVGVCAAKAIAALGEAGITHEVVVCDNGSIDASAERAAAAGARVVKESRKGYGWACATAIERSRGRILLISDADGTYPLEDAPAFAERARQDGVLVLGSRLLGEIQPGSMPLLHRLIGNPGTRLLLRLLFGVRCSDPHSGMRAMTRKTYERIKPATHEFEFTIQMVLNAKRRSVDLVDIPITYGARVGQSKLRALPEGWSLLRFLLLNSPTFLYLLPGAGAAVLGLIGIAFLARGNRTIGPATLGINSLVVACLLTVGGFQVITLGICARAYAATQSTGAHGPPRFFTLERGLAAGSVVLLTGVALIVRVGTRWLSTDFGSVPSSGHRLALLGLTASLLGLQTIFSSFFLSLFGRPDHLA